MDGIAGIKFLLEGDFKDVIAVTKAHFAFYASIGKLRKKRKLQKNSEVSGIYGKSIVFEHYLAKKKTFKELDKEKFSK